MINQKKFFSKEKRDYTNYFIAGFILLIAATLVFIQNEAQNQNNKLQRDFLLYQETNTYLQKGETEPIIEPLSKLHETYNMDFNISYGLAFSYLNNGNYEAALPMYTKSMDLNPFLVENEDFMYQYALVLSYNEQYEDAITVINQLLTLPIDESFKAEVTKLKDSLSNKKGSTT
ncbi:tetratricopeptide repeat protein [Psychrobacillus psychrodurans]|uniref:tetratricopeptide repeat protein n=1 Tax=Psychrobacillus psychrodurans TaxID=126157 RepID=UPI003D01F834